MLKKNIFIIGEDNSTKLLFSKFILRKKNRYILRKVDGTIFNDYLEFYSDKNNNIDSFSLENKDKLNYKFGTNDNIFFFINDYNALNKIINIIRLYKNPNFYICNSSSNSNLKKQIIIDKHFLKKNNIDTTKVNLSVFDIGYENDVNQIINFYFYINNKFLKNNFKIINYNKKTYEQRCDKLMLQFPYASNTTPYGPQYWKEYESTPDYTYGDNIKIYFLSNFINSKLISLSNIFIIFSKFYLLLKYYSNLRLLNQLFYHPINCLKRIKLISRRIFDLFFMILTFFLYPKKIHLFSSRNSLPKHNDKIKYLNDDFLPIKVDFENSSNVEKFNNINIVLRGDSLFNIKNIKINGPIFLTSVINPSEINRVYNILDLENKEIVYLFNHIGTIKLLHKKGLKCIFVDCSENDNLSEDQIQMQITNKKFCDTNNIMYIRSSKTLFPKLKKDAWTPTGSGLVNICAILPFANQINIYGWDCHLKKSPKKMNFISLLNQMIDIEAESRSYNHFETMLINIYFGYMLSKNSKINLDNSYLGQLQNHKYMIKKIKGILFA